MLLSGALCNQLPRQDLTLTRIADPPTPPQCGKPLLSQKKSWVIFHSWSDKSLAKCSFSQQKRADSQKSSSYSSGISTWKMWSVSQLVPIGPNWFSESSCFSPEAGNCSLDLLYFLQLHLHLLHQHQSHRQHPLLVQEEGFGKVFRSSRILSQNLCPVSDWPALCSASLFCILSRWSIRGRNARRTWSCSYFCLEMESVIRSTRHSINLHLELHLDFHLDLHLHNPTRFLMRVW